MGEFEKPSFYDQFQNYGVLNMFSIKANKPHAARKRMIANVYSKSFIQSSEEVHEMTRLILFDRMLPVINTHGFSLEVFEFNYAVTLDFIGSYLFGLSDDTNFIQDIEMRKRFLNWYYKRNEHDFWNQELPSVTRLLRNLGIHLVPKWVHAANDKFEAWMLQSCRDAEDSLKNPSSPAKARRTHPVVYSQLADALKRSVPKTEPSTDPELHIASELLDHVIAGMDTSAYTLSFIFWELSRQPDLQTSLRDELLTLSPPLTPENKSTVPCARSVDTLPLLHAVVMETLRLHAAISGPQPRLTPSTPTSLAGSPPLPAGVRVSAQAYSLHRNETVFPDPETWLPERWLDADQAKKDDMMRWFWAFGSGSRMCIGSNLAMQEIKYVTAAIYTNFTSSIEDDTGMDPRGANRAVPTGEELVVRFCRV
ncbi:MAG: hypothetical protein Q9195_007888 [Heterodermia aff. obscurata]